MKNRKAFTLIEVLISVALLGLMIVPLFSVVQMMQTSNKKMLHSLERSKKITKVTKVLFLDILGSNGKLSIKKDEVTRLCIDETTNSLYNLPVAKVCWLVLKEKNKLVRVEGSGYKLPLKSDDKVEVDILMQGIEIFDVYHEKDKVLVLLQQKNKKPNNFMVQGITNPVLEVLADGTQIMRDGRKILRDGTQIFKDGSKILPNGTHVPAPNKKTTQTKENNNTRVRPKVGDRRSPDGSNGRKPDERRPPDSGNGRRPDERRPPDQGDNNGENRP